jgi:predicted transcriptional regulator
MCALGTQEEIVSGRAVQKAHSSVRLRPDLLERADRLAAMLERSRGWVMEKALERYLDEEEREIAEVRQSLAEAEAGEVVDGEEVHRWMDSWGTEKERQRPEPKRK